MLKFNFQIKNGAPVEVVGTEGKTRLFIDLVHDFKARQWTASCRKTGLKATGEDFKSVLVAFSDAYEAKKTEPQPAAPSKT